MILIKIILNVAVFLLIVALCWSMIECSQTYRFHSIMGASTTEVIIVWLFSISLCLFAIIGGVYAFWGIWKL